MTFFSCSTKPSVSQFEKSIYIIAYDKTKVKYFFLCLNENLTLYFNSFVELWWDNQFNLELECKNRKRIFQT